MSFYPHTNDIASAVIMLQMGKQRLTEVQPFEWPATWVSITFRVFLRTFFTLPDFSQGNKRMRRNMTSSGFPKSISSFLSKC